MLACLAMVFHFMLFFSWLDRNSGSRSMLRRKLILWASLLWLTEDIIFFEMRERMDSITYSEAIFFVNTWSTVDDG